MNYCFLFSSKTFHNSLICSSKKRFSKQNSRVGGLHDISIDCRSFSFMLERRFFVFDFELYKCLRFLWLDHIVLLTRWSLMKSNLAWVWALNNRQNTLRCIECADLWNFIASLRSVNGHFLLLKSTTVNRTRKRTLRCSKIIVSWHRFVLSVTDQ